MRTVKKLLTIIGIIALIAILPQKVFAEESSNECLDINEIYSNLQIQSENIVGEGNSYDLIKKEKMASKLIMVIEALAGDSAICDQDGNPSGEEEGLLGFVSNSTTSLVNGYPVGTTSKLISREIEGVESRTSLFAETAPTDQELLNESETSIDGFKKGFRKELGALEQEEPTVGWCKPESCSCDTGYSVCDIEARDGGVCKCVEGSKIYYNSDYSEGIPENGYSYLESVGLVDWWSFMRNIAYVGFIVVMIIVGFMIMFRKNLSSQVVVGINNALPQVILGLVLTTFSFAIVGIMLDFGRTLMGVTETFIRGGFGEESEELDIVPIGSLSDYSDSAISTYIEHGQKFNFFYIGESAEQDGFWRSLLPEDRPGEDIGGNVNIFYSRLKNLSLWSVVTTGIRQWDLSGGTGIDIALMEPLNAIKNLAMFGWQVVNVPQLIILIIVLLISVYAGFRIFVSILLLYAKIFIDTVTAPLVMLSGSLPGNGSAILDWFKRIAASILSFVGIFLVINFVRYLALSNVFNLGLMNFFGNSTMIWPQKIIPMEFIIVVFGYLFAANVPKLVSGMLKVGQSKEMAGALQGTKQAASKIPLIGTLFKG